MRLALLRGGDMSDKHALHNTYWSIADIADRALPRHKLSPLSGLEIEERIDALEQYAVSTRFSATRGETFNAAEVMAAFADAGFPITAESTYTET